jgi:hypothetical protein
MKSFFVRTLHGLSPTDEISQAALKGVKIGALVAVEVTRPRNIQHHRLYWKLVSVIAESIGAEPENISDVLKLRTGHVRTIQTKQGIVRLPKSISFAALDQAGFSEFFNRACQVVCQEWLPHMTADVLRQDIEDMVVGNKRSAA